MLEEDDFLDAAIYITPPGNGDVSDEDCGDEDEGACFHNLNHRQLTADTEVVMRDTHGETHRIGSFEDSASDQVALNTSTSANRARPEPPPATAAPVLAATVPTSTAVASTSASHAQQEPQAFPVSSAAAPPALVPPAPAPPTPAPTEHAQRVPAPAAPAPPALDPPAPAGHAQRAPRAPTPPAPPALAPPAPAGRAQRAPRAPAPPAPALPAPAPAGRAQRAPPLRRAQPALAQRAQPAQRNWQHQDIPRNGLPTQRPFPNIPAPAFLNHNLSPVEMFECFFDDDVIDLIVDQTNLYAHRDKGNHAFTTNRQDMKTFLGILLLSGYNSLPRRPMYWERSIDCRNAAVAEAMSRNRFDDHMRYLHLQDNNLDPTDKLTKVRNFLCQINEHCLLFFPTQRNLSIDESMIPYFGHHSSKQFIKSKPIRFGFKVWSLADPLGYVIQFDTYVGARGVQQPYGPLGLGGSVVKDLISELPQFPFHLTFDNYFTSLPLLADLAANGIGATGTIRKNRVENCPLRDPVRLGRDLRGSLDYTLDRRDNILVTEWNDNSVVMMATNCDPVAPLGNVRRWSRQQRQFINIQQPYINRVYNATMGGVDRADQNISKYRITMRTKKWWWPFFAYAVDLAVQNAWLLYRRTGDMMDLLTFRRKVAQTYLMRHGAAAAPVRPGQMLPFAPRVPDARQERPNRSLQHRLHTEEMCKVSQEHKENVHKVPSWPSSSLLQ